MLKRATALSIICFVWLLPLLFQAQAAGDRSILNNSRDVFIQPDSSDCNSSMDSSGLAPKAEIKDSLSLSPTSAELKRLLILASAGQRDPFRIVSLIAAAKDSALPSLRGFLFQQAADTVPGEKILKKEFAIHVLDAIATRRAEHLLMEIASAYPETEIKGLAMKVLASNLYYRLQNSLSGDSSISAPAPDKRIVHILLQNADDTTFIENCNEALGKIAREGLLNWIGVDYGELPAAQGSSNASDGLAAQGKDTREQWWTNNKDKLAWNTNTGRFEVKQ